MSVCKGDGAQVMPALRCSSSERLRAGITTKQGVPTGWSLAESLRRRGLKAWLSRLTPPAGLFSGIGSCGQGGHVAMPTKPDYIAEELATRLIDVAEAQRAALCGFGWSVGGTAFLLRVACRPRFTPNPDRSADSTRPTDRTGRASTVTECYEW